MAVPVVARGVVVLVMVVGGLSTQPVGPGAGAQLLREGLAPAVKEVYPVR